MIAHPQSMSVPTQSALRLLALCLATMVPLAACSEKPTLTLAEKTAFVAELVDARIECAEFAHKFATPAPDEQSLNALYQAAKAAHCLKPDV